MPFVLSLAASSTAHLTYVVSRRSAEVWPDLLAPFGSGSIKCQDQPLADWLVYM